MGAVHHHPALEISSGPSQPRDRGLTAAKGGQAICENSLHCCVHSIASFFHLSVL
uniref:Uncharacterized protein n=1 Tax=Arundo donax TaxID=35708 RepID=A0A0A9GEC2_ARUDO